MLKYYFVTPHNVPNDMKATRSLPDELTIYPGACINKFLTVLVKAHDINEVEEEEYGIHLCCMYFVV